MSTITIAQIDERLQQLSPDKLQVVYKFVSDLVEREDATIDVLPDTDAWQTMLASEAVLRRNWDRPEEDEAGAHL